MAPLTTGLVGLEININFYLSLISFTILYYDYALTIVPEIELFWRPKNRTAFVSLLFFFHRYLAILGHIPIIYETFSLPEEGKICSGLTEYHQYHMSVLQAMTAVLCLMRVSALYGHHRGVIALLCTIILGIFAATCVSVFLWRPQPAAPSPLTAHLPGCLVEYPESEALRLAVTWGGVLIFDITIFALTMYKARALDWRHPGSIVHILMRDGAFYFFILFLANVANILAIMLAPSLLKATPAVVTNVISATLVSRLMINLRIENARLHEEWGRPIKSERLDIRTSEPSHTNTGE